MIRYATLARTLRPATRALHTRVSCRKDEVEDEFIGLDLDDDFSNRTNSKSFKKTDFASKRGSSFAEDNDYGFGAHPEAHKFMSNFEIPKGQKNQRHDSQIRSKQTGFDSFTESRGGPQKPRNNERVAENERSYAFNKDDSKSSDWGTGLDKWIDSDYWKEPTEWGHTQPRALDPQETERQRYFMPQGMDMTPLRGQGEITQHFVQKPEFESESTAFEKIFAQVMSRGKGKTSDKGGSLEAEMQNISASVGIEPVIASQSPYVGLFKQEHPEVYAKIAAETDIEARHDLIVQMDVSELPADQKEVISELQELITLDSDYELIEFMSKKLEVFDELAKNDSVFPTELPAIAEGFPLLLNEALQVLIEQFESPAEAISLFDEVRTRSGKLFFATVSTEVSFSMIKIVWEFYRDLPTLIVLGEDIAMMNMKSRPVVKLLEEIERECYKSMESRKRRIPEYEDTITCRVYSESLRRFSILINHLRRGLKLQVLAQN